MAATDRHDSDYSGNETRNDFEELRERAIAMRIFATKRFAFFLSTAKSGFDCCARFIRRGAQFVDARYFLLIPSSFLFSRHSRMRI